MNLNAPTNDHFVSLLTDYQSRLWAFVYSVVGNAELAQEIFQETNLVLWRKAGQFNAARPFGPWAKAIARNQILAAQERISRDRLVFDEEVVGRIADSYVDSEEENDQTQVALAHCIEKLSPDMRLLVDQRYRDQIPLAQVAESSQRSVSGLAVTMHRVRKSLADCIEKALAREVGA